MVATLLLLTSLAGAPQSPAPAPDFSTLQDSVGQASCVWVRDNAKGRQVLAKLPTGCGEVRRIALNQQADEALVSLGDDRPNTTPRFFRLDLTDPKATLEPLPVLTQSRQKWFDLLFGCDSCNKGKPTLFTIAPVKPEDRNTERDEPTLHVYDLTDHMWKLQQVAHPDLQTDEVPNPATLAYWERGFSPLSFDVAADEEPVITHQQKKKMTALCRTRSKSGANTPDVDALWDTSNTIGMCHVVPESGEGWSTLTGDGGMWKKAAATKRFTIPELSGLSAGDIGRVQVQGRYLMLCGSRRIWDISVNRIAKQVEGLYPVALWPNHLGPQCQTQPDMH